MKEIENREKGHEMSSSAQDTNSLQLLVLCLHKNRLIKRQALIQDGLRGSYSSLLNYLLLRDSWRGGGDTIAFECVFTGSNGQIESNIHTDGLGETKWVTKLTLNL